MNTICCPWCSGVCFVGCPFCYGLGRVPITPLPDDKPDTPLVVEVCPPPDDGAVSQQTLRLKGRIRSIAPGRQDPTLTDAEWDTLLVGEACPPPSCQPPFVPDLLQERQPRPMCPV